MKTVKQVLMLVVIILGLVIVSQRLSVFPLHDFIEYWTAGRLNLTGGNPYDASQMMRLQQSIGWTGDSVQMMWNPPWTLPFVMFLGLFPFSFSRLLWFLCCLFIFFIAADTFWKIYHLDDKKRWIAWVAVLAFGPTLQVLKFGQIVPLLIVGYTGFLTFYRKEQFFWAGVLASLVLIKPHSLYLFVVAVTLWALSYRKWKFLAGLVITPLCLTGIAMITNPNLISQYIEALIQYPPEDWATATLGTPLRLLFGPDLFFLQFLPTVLGLIWFIFYWLKHWKTWQWEKQLPLLVMVSAATAAYGWAFDVSVAIIAIVQIAAWFNFKEWRLQTILLFTAFWAVSLLNAFLSVNQHWFWWLASYYLVWYIVANKIVSPPKEFLSNLANYETA